MLTGSNPFPDLIGPKTEDKDDELQVGVKSLCKDSIEKKGIARRQELLGSPHPGGGSGREQETRDRISLFLLLDDRHRRWKDSCP